MGSPCIATGESAPHLVTRRRLGAVVKAKHNKNKSGIKHLKIKKQTCNSKASPQTIIKLVFYTEVQELKFLRAETEVNPEMELAPL